MELCICKFRIPEGTSELAIQLSCKPRLFWYGYGPLWSIPWDSKLDISIIFGWWFGTFLFFHWEQSSQLTFIFFRGVAQPPDWEDSENQRIVGDFSVNPPEMGTLLGVTLLIWEWGQVTQTTTLKSLYTRPHNPLYLVPLDPLKIWLLIAHTNQAGLPEGHIPTVG